MNSRANQRAFEKLVTGPLSKLVGTPLRSVEYYALDGTLPDFDPSDLIASGGCQAVHLTFDGGEVELDWANVSDLRDPERYFAYHLMVRPLVHGQASSILGGRTPVDVAETSLWKSVLGEPLLSATVLGVLLKEGRAVPQAVKLTFPSSRIFVIVGWTSVPLSLGDGDEVLVFSSEEWAGLRPDDFFAGDWPVPLSQAGSAGTE